MSQNTWGFGVKKSKFFDRRPCWRCLVVVMGIMGCGVASADIASKQYVDDTNTTYSAGTNVTITGENNAINVATGSKNARGVVQVGDNINVDTNGKISVPAANGTAQAGVVKAGDNITITNGVISTHAPTVDTNTTYSAGTNVTITGTNNAINVADATASTKGVVKLDDALSTTSTNPVQNKVVAGEVNEIKSSLGGLLSKDVFMAIAVKHDNGVSVGGPDQPIYVGDDGRAIAIEEGGMDGKYVKTATADTYGVVKVDMEPNRDSPNPVANAVVTDELAKLTAFKVGTKEHASQRVLASDSTGVVVDGTLAGSNGVSATVDASGNVAIAGVDATGESKGVVQAGENINIVDGVISVGDGSAGVKGVVYVDDELTEGSTNPVESQVVQSALDTKVNVNQTANQAMITGPDGKVKAGRINDLMIADETITFEKLYSVEEPGPGVTFVRLDADGRFVKDGLRENDFIDTVAVTREDTTQPVGSSTQAVYVDKDGYVQPVERVALAGNAEYAENAALADEAADYTKDGGIAIALGTKVDKNQGADKNHQVMMVKDANVTSGMILPENLGYGGAGEYLIEEERPDGVLFVSPDTKGFTVGQVSGRDLDISDESQYDGDDILGTVVHQDPTTGDLIRKQVQNTDIAEGAISQTSLDYELYSGLVKRDDTSTGVGSTDVPVYVDGNGVVQPADGLKTKVDLLELYDTDNDSWKSKFSVHRPESQAVGSANQPVYVDASGKVQPVNKISYNYLDGDTPYWALSHLTLSKMVNEGPFVHTLYDDDSGVIYYETRNITVPTTSQADVLAPSGQAVIWIE